MSDSEYWESVQQKLRSADDRELMLAAEALVDAAICCRKLKFDEEITEENRLLLIDALYRDPLVTADLFK